MGFFSAPQLALASGLSVFYGELYRLEFLSGDGFYWDGVGDLSAYGETWIGAANLVARGEIPMGVDDEAGQLTLTLSGVDAGVVAAVRAAETEIYGRGITIWGQMFDEALQISGGRFQLFSGTMDVPTYTATGPTSRSIAIPCESEWSDRERAAYSAFTPNDQARRFPSTPDRGLDYVYRYNAGVKRRWPHLGS